MNEPANVVKLSELSNVPRSFPRPRHVMVGLLIAAAIIVQTLAVELAKFTGATPFSPVASLVIGLSFGNVALAAIYLALGRQTVVIRCLAALVIALAAGFVGSVCEPDPESEVEVWRGVFLFNTFLIATPILYLWARGLRLIHSEHPPEAQVAGRPRFSLWTAMSGMTCLAIVLAVARNLEFPVQATVGILLVAVATGGVAMTAVATLLGKTSIPVALGWIGGAVLVATWILRTFARIGPDAWSVFGTILVEGAFVAVVMLVLRMAGYRLRWPIYQRPVVHSTPFAATGATNNAPAESATPNQP
jgi:hypothetical protein